VSLEAVPLDLSDANALVAKWHRHHRPVVGHKASIGVAVNGELVGAAILSRPTARRLDDGWTLEVSRCVTDGTPNACSFLYSRAKKIAWALGYKRLLTFTLATEPGTSLKAAGWAATTRTPGKSWSVPSRPRVDKHPLQERIRWEVEP
jgi:hypothetical protein